MRLLETVWGFVVATLSVSLAWGQEGDLPAGSARAPYRVPAAGMSVADPFPFLGTDLNPAAMAFFPDLQLFLQYGHEVQGGAFAVGLGDILSVSFGVDRLDPQGFDPGWRTSLDVGLTLGGVMSVAFMWQRTLGDSEWSGRDPMGVGMLLRPSRWMSFGLAAHNVNGEVFPEPGPARRRTSSREYVLGIAVRPGTDRFAVRADVATTHKGDYFDPSFSLSVLPVPGVEIAANLHLRKQESPGGDWYWGTAALVSIYSSFGDLFGGYRYEPDGSDSALVAARFASTPERTVIQGKGRFVRYDLPVRIEEEERGGILWGSAPTLLQVRTDLARMERDPEVRGVFLVLRAMKMGWAQAQELAVSVEKLGASGKTVVAYLLDGGNKEYYIASHCQYVVMNSASSLQLTGISYTMTFLADLMKWVGLEGQFVRVGEYKSFPEQFERTEPSPENLEAETAMVDDFFEQLVSGVAKARKVDEGKVREWIDGGPYTPAKAREAGLVDLVAPLTDVEAILKDLSIAGRTSVVSWPVRGRHDDSWGKRPQIAYVVIEGTITDGRSGSIPLTGIRFTGAETLRVALKQIEESSSVKGLLLRINSPGGSALGSEEINRALARVAARKPVVVSLSNVGASGGYYIASAGHRIFSSPGSVTGSIGIWFGKVVVSGLLDNLSISRTNISRGKNARMNDMDYKLTDEQLAHVTACLQELYDLFVARVVEGRRMERERVEKLARGRVWSGKRALDNGLVDEKGGVLEALEYLKARLGLARDRKVELVHYPLKRFSQKLVESLGVLPTTGWPARLEEVIAFLSRTSAWAMDPRLVF